MAARVKLKGIILIHTNGRKDIIKADDIHYVQVATGVVPGKHDRVQHEVVWVTQVKEKELPPITDAEKAELERK